MEASIEFSYLAGWKLQRSTRSRSRTPPRRPEEDSSGDRRGRDVTRDENLKKPRFLLGRIQVAEKFSVGETVRIKTENPEDVKRVPAYIKGKVGTVHKVRGRIINPRDHHDRPPVYSIVFAANDLFPGTTGSDSVIVEVFEDWMIPNRRET